MMHSFKDEYKEEMIKKDFIERLRILEIAVQQTVDELSKSMKRRSSYNQIKWITECHEKLDNALKKSFEIAVKEY